jgi:hypothetical protein
MFEIFKIIIQNSSNRKRKSHYESSHNMTVAKAFCAVDLSKRIMKKVEDYQVISCFKQS